MSLRQIIFTDNPILRKKCIRIKDFEDAEFQNLIDDMVETMLDAPGVGLAAPQVAISKRLIVVRLPDDPDSQEEYGEDAGELYIVANPEIVKTSKETVEEVEACLSIPGYFGTVERYISVEIKGKDRHGKPLRIKAKDWLARVFQHEIDHLDGVLFTDKATDVWKAPEEEASEENEGEPTTSEVSPS